MVWAGIQKFRLACESGSNLSQFLIGGAARGFDEICAHYALTEVLGPQPPLTQD